jgi:hypothetical protein
MFLDKLEEVPAPPVQTITRTVKISRTLMVTLVVMLVGVLGTGAWWIATSKITMSAIFGNKQKNSTVKNINTAASRLSALTESSKLSFTDSDDDGLYDDLEALYGTDLGNPDTDGDGFQDSAEIRFGYDPLNQKSAARMVDLSLIDRVLVGTAPPLMVSSGYSTADHDRYYLVLDNAGTTYYTSDGTMEAQCQTSADSSGACVTLPNSIRTDFFRSFENGKFTDIFHIPF